MLFLTLMPHVTSLSLATKIKEHRCPTSPQRECICRDVELLKEPGQDGHLLPVASVHCGKPYCLDASLLQHCFKHMPGLLELELEDRPSISTFDALVQSLPGLGCNLKALTLTMHLEHEDKHVAASFATCFATLATMASLQSLVPHLGCADIDFMNDGFRVQHLPTALTKLEMGVEMNTKWAQMLTLSHVLLTFSI